MQFTTHEIESPDPVTRVAAPDASLREPEQHDIGEKMVLTWGLASSYARRLRLVLELDVRSSPKPRRMSVSPSRATRDRRDMQYNQFVPYTEPGLDYLAPPLEYVAYALRWKVDGLGDSAPWKSNPHDAARHRASPRNLLGFGAMALRSRRDVGLSLHLHGAGKLYNLFELLTGARFTTSYHARGGQIRDLPEALSRNSKIPSTTLAWSRRMRQVADPEQIFVDPQKTSASSRKGARDRVCDFRPNLRGSGSNTIAPQTSVSRLRPYDFDVVIGSAGDCSIVILVRVEECAERANFGAGHR